MSAAYAGVLLYRGANQRYTTCTQGFTVALHLLSVLSLVRPHMLACLFSSATFESVCPCNPLLQT